MASDLDCTWGKVAFPGRMAYSGNSVVLKTLATTSTRNGPGYPANVTLYEDPRYFRSQGVTLHIDGTPGAWPLEDLLSRPPREIAIDFGRHWYWTNPEEVLEEARKLVRQTFILRNG